MNPEKSPLSAEDKRLLLSRLVRDMGFEAALHPLSYAQERLWFVEKVSPPSPVYSVPIVVRLTGPLDRPALSRGLSELVRRHEALRMKLRSAGGRPVQVVGPPYRIDLVPEPAGPAEATGPSETAGPGEAAGSHPLPPVPEAVRREVERPFDLTREGTLRVRLYRRGDDDHLLLLNLHHIVADGWSLDLLFEELGRLYEVFRAGHGSPHGSPPAGEGPSYVAHVGRERAPEREPLIRDGVEWWREYLAGLDPLLELPRRNPRPPVQSPRGDVRPGRLSPETAAALRELSRREGLTVSSMLMAAYFVLLHRFTGRTDLVVGLPAANRAQAGTEGLVGFLVNMLPVRVEVSPRESFIGLARRTRDAVLEALAHQDIPFTRLVTALAPERDPSYHPIFQVVFSYHTPPAHALRLAGLSVEPLWVYTGTAKFDLSLMAYDDGASLRSDLEYRSELFEDDEAGRLLDGYGRLLSAAVARPDACLSELDLLGSDERRRVLSEWSRDGEGRSPYTAPSGRLVHEIFEERARTAPDAPALVFGERCLSYGELNRRAECLAETLRRAGVGPEDIVALMLDRSVEMIVALLGVLKAGGAYVPLDPTHPAERRAFVLEDTRARVIVTQPFQGDRPALPESGSAAVIFLDEGGTVVPIPILVPIPAADAAAADSAPAPRAVLPGARRPLPGNLAYVIYTSGSTGRPKGVLVTHGGVENMAEAQLAVFQRRPEDRILQFAALTFDASIFELVMAWRVGARVHLAPREEIMPGRPLATRLREDAISTVTLPPSALAALPEDAELPELKTIVVAGEACPAEVVSRWAPGRRFFNAYGPTETTVWATVSECEPDGGTPDIGRPIPGVGVFVLDEDLRPVPPGVPGELCIAGAGLARGYINRPDLTAERFVPDPHSPSPGGRLYRTGDRVRHLAGGRLDFLGRLDRQVKVRGFRVEPGEIEVVLTHDPRVRDAAVVVGGDARGRPRLTAFVAGTDPGPGLAAALRARLRELLPEYMVPSEIIVLPSLPKTSSGKTDQRALERQASQTGARERSQSSTGRTASPLSPTEAEVAAVWRDVLGHDTFEPDENFFDLGGHSLLLMEVQTRLERALGRTVPVVELFRHSTVRTLAAHLEGEASGGPESDDSGEARAAPTLGEVAATAADRGRSRQAPRSPRRSSP